MCQISINHRYNYGEVLYSGDFDVRNHGRLRFSPSVPGGEENDSTFSKSAASDYETSFICDCLD